MTNHLPEAFHSPLLGWLTITFFLTASVVTYLKRIDQHKKVGALPAEAPSAPTWLFTLFALIEFAAKIALIVLNWQFGLILYALGFVLASMPVLETVGSLLMFPFVRTVLPDDSFDAAAGDDPFLQSIVLPAKKRHFAVKLLWIVAWYVGLTILLNHVVRRMDAASPFLWGLAILQVYMYFYIFTLSYVRLRECSSKVAWSVGFLAVLGRVNDYELLIIPAVVLTALIISGVQRLPEPLAEAEPSLTEDG